MPENPTHISKNTDFLKGSIILFYKPIGWTSFDLVKKVRNIIKLHKNIKKIKVGHAGTLDPLAEGLLIICTGKFTKKISLIQSEKKLYTGEITLGATTPSYDQETDIDKYFNISHITKELIHHTSKKFHGEIMQKPPVFSALKQNGVRLYKEARKGKKINVKSRPVTIHNFKICKINMPSFTFEVCCGKGTYIRSLAHDFGRILNSGAYLSSLKREGIGNYLLSEAYTIQKFEKSMIE